MSEKSYRNSFIESYDPENIQYTDYIFKLTLIELFEDLINELADIKTFLSNIDCHLVSEDV
jgi:hypothetical protein